ncbi:MAG: hypothetical protein IID32_00385 [Planctomycetes bacterium]|nr:hypothetical protein [Planctomycetota bacterium]
MPWQENTWIAACNPVKLKEYLALGKPIVSTPFSELERYNGLVQTASDPITFAQAVRHVLQEDNDERVRARRKAVAESSWDAKAQQVMEELF